jgi:hypothetical protein
VIVPDDSERELRVRRLEIGIELVQRVAQAVGAQIAALGAEAVRGGNSASGRSIDRVLVGVVAEVEHQVEVVPQHVAIGDVEAARPVLAGDEREARLANHLVGARRGAEVADGALLAADVELIEVVASRAQAVHLDVDGVGKLRRGNRDAARDHMSHAAVGCDAPAHRHERVAEALGGGGLGREPRPQDDPVLGRIARGDAERERVVAKSRRRKQIVPGQQRQRQAGADTAPGVVEKPPAIELRRKSFGGGHAVLVSTAGFDRRRAHAMNWRTRRRSEAC